VELQRSCEGGIGVRRRIGILGHTVAMLTAHHGQAKSMAAVMCSVAGGCTACIRVADGRGDRERAVSVVYAIV